MKAKQKAPRFRLNLRASPINLLNTIKGIGRSLKVIIFLLIATSCSTVVRVNGVAIKTKKKADSQERKAYVAAFIVGFAAVTQLKKDR